MNSPRPGFCTRGLFTQRMQSIFDFHIGFEVSQNTSVGFCANKKRISTKCASRKITNPGKKFGNQISIRKGV